MDQTDEEGNGEFQDDCGDDASGIGDIDNAGHVDQTTLIVRRCIELYSGRVDVELDSDLKDDLDLDSLDVVQILVEIEADTGKEIDVKELWGIHTVEDLVRVVRKFMED